jgi:hypothetical protein
MSEARCTYVHGAPVWQPDRELAAGDVPPSINTPHPMGTVPHKTVFSVTTDEVRRPNTGQTVKFGRVIHGFRQEPVRRIPATPSTLFLCHICPFHDYPAGSVNGTP